MAERTIKVAFTKTIRMVTIPTMLSFLVSLMMWKHISFTPTFSYVSIGISSLLLLLLFQIRFISHMTVRVWSNLWGSIAPLLAGSVFTLPFHIPIVVLFLMPLIVISIGVWAGYRFFPLLIDKRLHKSRFARLDEIEPLLSRKPVNDGLILGSVKQFYLFRHYICVRPTKQKKEIGNSLIIAPTGGGKGNLIRGQIVAWKHSLIINDPKGDLYSTTASYRATLGDVFVI